MTEWVQEKIFTSSVGRRDQEFRAERQSLPHEEGEDFCHAPNRLHSFCFDHKLHAIFRFLRPKQFSRQFRLHCYNEYTHIDIHEYGCIPFRIWDEIIRRHGRDAAPRRAEASGRPGGTPLPKKEFCLTPSLRWW